MFSSYIRQRLQSRVKQYFSKNNDVKLIVVTGSAGKISTKRAIADVLAQKYRVRMREGAARDQKNAMLLGMLGIVYPEKSHNPLAWLAVLRAAKKRVTDPIDVDIVIQELYSEKPGDIERFAEFIEPDFAVLTSITPEKMDKFGDIESVAKEELSISKFAKYTFVNRDDIDGKFAEYIQSSSFSTYGTSGLAEYHYEIDGFSVENGYVGRIALPESHQSINAELHVVGEYSIRPIMAAVAVASQVGMAPEDIAFGVSAIRPAAGRMNLLHGLSDTIVVDDTYNSSPISMVAALQALYLFDQAPTRIAVLADMTGLGEQSQLEHEKIGSMCDPNSLAWVVVVGEESEKYLAPAARARGCQVKVCRDAIEAGSFVRSVTEPRTVILVKGPKDGFYMEEAVKVLCSADEDKALVRQGIDWMDRKRVFFDRFK